MNKWNFSNPKYHVMWNKLYFTLMNGYGIKWEDLPNIRNICDKMYKIYK